MTKYVSILLDMAYFWHSPESSKTISSQTETNAHFISIGSLLVSTFTDIPNNNLTWQHHTWTGAMTKASTPGDRMNTKSSLLLPLLLPQYLSSGKPWRASTAPAGAQDTQNVLFQGFKKDESVPYPGWLAGGSACVREVQILGVPAWNEVYVAPIWWQQRKSWTCKVMCLVRMKEVCYFLRKMEKHRVRSKSKWFCSTCLCPSKCTPSQLMWPITANGMNDVTPAPGTNPYAAPDPHTPPRLIFLIHTPGVDHHLSARRGYVTPPESTCQSSSSQSESLSSIRAASPKT